MAADSADSKGGPDRRADVDAGGAGWDSALVKLSGEALGGPAGVGFDHKTIASLAADLAAAARGRRLAVVVGGGNIWRGASAAAKAAGIDRVSADHMGMLATVMNAIALERAIVAAGAPAVAMSAIGGDRLVAPYSRRAARARMDAGEIVICAGGSGNPLFTTDTAAVIRAVELDCAVMAKATQVDGVYSADPKTCPDAERFDQLSYSDILSRRLRVMDAAAVAVAEENALALVVFSIADAAGDGRGAIARALDGAGARTVVS